MKKVIWLGRGIAGDDTHGHVDDIARFVGPSTIVTAYEPDRNDPNHEPLQENYRKLPKSTDQVGQAVAGGQASDAGAGLFPPTKRCRPATPISTSPTTSCWFRCSTIPTTAIALNILAELMPRRKIVGIYCGDFIWGLGALHCMTQQQPAG